MKPRARCRLDGVADTRHVRCAWRVGVKRVVFCILGGLSRGASEDIHAIDRDILRGLLPCFHGDNATSSRFTDAPRLFFFFFSCWTFFVVDWGKTPMTLRTFFRIRIMSVHPFTLFVYTPGFVSDDANASSGTASTRKLPTHLSVRFRVCFFPPEPACCRPREDKTFTDLFRRRNWLCGETNAF